MFHDLDSTLEQLIGAAPAAELPQLNAAEVSFRTPDRNFTVPAATLDLFLYEVRENRQLRDPTPVVERDGARFLRRPAPLRADCSYIVTAWSNASLDQQVEEEHQLLGQALTWLSRFPTIPGPFLQGFLGDPDLIYPPPTMVAQLDPNQHAGDFWTAMGVSPRPAFYVTVTIELALGDGLSGDLVLTTMTDYDVAAAPDRPWVTFGGQVVTTAPSRAIADAVVDIVDISLRTRSVGDGRYAFGRVPRGPHTLRVVARGFRPETQPFEVPGRPEDYVVTLTPI